MLEQTLLGNRYFRPNELPLGTGEIRTLGTGLMALFDDAFADLTLKTKTDMRAVIHASVTADLIRGDILPKVLLKLLCQFLKQRLITGLGRDIRVTGRTGDPARGKLLCHVCSYSQFSAITYADLIFVKPRL